jgi:hypothetical protein
MHNANLALWLGFDHAAKQSLDFRSRIPTKAQPPQINSALTQEAELSALLLTSEKCHKQTSQHQLPHTMRSIFKRDTAAASALR